MWSICGDDKTAQVAAAKHLHVQLMLIAVDVDGTLFDGVAVAHEAEVALRAAKAAGHTLVIVTGRRWESLPSVVPNVLSLFDRVVAEEGAVLVNVATAEVRLLADAVTPELVAALEAVGVTSLDVGQVVIGAPREFESAMTEIRDRVAPSRHVVVNKGSVALAPGGCDKASGLRAAVVDLGVEHLPILAIGDATNDLAMFAIATIAVAVANADELVLASGVAITQESTGKGVAEALTRFLPKPMNTAGLVHPSSATGPAPTE